MEENRLVSGFQSLENFFKETAILRRKDGFCLTEVLIAELIKKSKGYLFESPGNRAFKRTNILFIDDLKVYANSHEKLRMMSEAIVTASSDTGALYAVKKCAEAVFKRTDGKIRRFCGT